VRVGADWYEVGGSGSGVFADNVFAVQDEADATKQFNVSLGGATASTTTTFIISQTANRNITFPNVNTSLAGFNVAQTWTAKQTFQDDGIDISNPADSFQYTLQAAAIAANRVLTLPLILGADTLAAIGLAQSWTAKQTFQDDSIEISNPADTFQYTLQAAALAADRILNLPLTLGTDTLATIGLAQVWTAIQTFEDDGVEISNPANTFQYTLQAAAIAADRVLTLPLITGADTLVALGLAQEFTAKQTFQHDGIDIQNPADTFQYTITAAAIAADRVLNLPLITATDTLTTIGFANAWGTINQNIAATGKWQEAGVAISPIGTQQQWIPAGAWGAVTTNGGEFAELELATNDIMLQTFNFDTTTSEKIQFWWHPPSAWDVGTITFQTYWTAASGSGTVIFSLAGRSLTDSDAIDAAIGGTPATTTDTLLTANDMHISPISSAVTINGATKNEPVLLQISRDVSDTLGVDAKLVGVKIIYITNTAVTT
ncbi:hypothetical protein LCGC14_1254400, partial [marine sediment metagenome]